MGNPDKTEHSVSRGGLQKGRQPVSDGLAAGAVSCFITYIETGDATEVKR